MKTIQKLTLGLLTVAGLSTSASAAASVTYNFNDGAILSGGVTGRAVLVGSLATDDLVFSSAVSDEISITKGRINLAAAPNVGTGKYMIMAGAAPDDANLLLSAAMILNKVNVAQTGVLDIAANATTLDAIAGVAGKALKISGSGALTLGDVSGHLGAIGTSGSYAAPTATVNGTTKFAAQDSYFAHLNLVAAPLLPASCDLHCTTLDVGFGVTTSNVIVGVPNDIYARTVNLGANSFAENVIAE
jgi:hypothetical protein